MSFHQADGPKTRKHGGTGLRVERVTGNAGQEMGEERNRNPQHLLLHVACCFEGYKSIESTRFPALLSACMASKFQIGLVPHAGEP